MTLAIHSVTRSKPAAPSFREKDAVCIEAHALQVNAAARPVHTPSFQYQMADLLIAAQLLRGQNGGPLASASVAAYAYRNIAAAMIPGLHGIRV